jgi:hypothetical protein
MTQINAVCSFSFVQVSDRAESLTAVEPEPEMHAVGIVRWSIVTVESAVMVVVPITVILVKLKVRILVLD